MKEDTWIVYFRGGGVVKVQASGITDAIILACAERIKVGNHISTIAIENETAGTHYGLGANPITINKS